MTGNSRIRNGAKSDPVRGSRALCAAAALCFSFPACPELPEPPGRDPGAKGASGSIVPYREASTGNIVRFEEQGGIISPLAPPAAGSRREALPEFGSVRKPQALTERATRKPFAVPEAATGKFSAPETLATKSPAAPAAATAKP